MHDDDTIYNFKAITFQLQQNIFYATVIFTITLNS